MNPERAANATWIALIICPIALVLLAPDLFDFNRWQGIALGLLVVFGQLILLIWLPDKVALLMAGRKEVAAKADGDGVAPAVSMAPWTHARRHDLRSGFTFWLDDTAGRAWATGLDGAAPQAALASDLSKYYEVLTQVLDEKRYLGWAGVMIDELHLLLSKVILNHRREAEFFREFPAAAIADRLYSYCQERAARESGR